MKFISMDMSFTSMVRHFKFLSDLKESKNFIINSLFQLLLDDILDAEVSKRLSFFKESEHEDKSNLLSSSAGTESRLMERTFNFENFITFSGHRQSKLSQNTTMTIKIHEITYL